MNARRQVLVAAALGAVALLGLACQPGGNDRAVVEELRSLRSAIERGAGTPAVAADVDAAFTPLRSALMELTRRQQDDRTRLVALAGDVRTLIDGGTAPAVAGSLDDAALAALRTRVDTLEKELKSELAEQRQAQELVLSALDLTTDKLQSFLTKLNAMTASGGALADERAAVPSKAPDDTPATNPGTPAPTTPQADDPLAAASTTDASQAPASNVDAASTTAPSPASETPTSTTSDAAVTPPSHVDTASATPAPNPASESPMSITDDEAATPASTADATPPAATKRAATPTPQPGNASLESLVGEPSSHEPGSPNAAATQGTTPRNATDSSSPERAESQATRPPEKSGLSWLLGGLVLGLGLGLAAAVTVLVLERRKQKTAHDRDDDHDHDAAREHDDALAAVEPPLAAPEPAHAEAFARSAEAARAALRALDLAAAEHTDHAETFARAVPPHVAGDTAPAPRWQDARLAARDAGQGHEPTSTPPREVRAASTPAAPRRPTFDPPLTYAQHVQHPAPAALAAEVSRWLADDPAVLTEPPPRVLVTQDGIDIRFHLAPEHAAHGGRLDGELAALARQVASAVIPAEDR